MFIIKYYLNRLLLIPYHTLSLYDTDLTSCNVTFLKVYIMLKSHVDGYFNPHHTRADAEMINAMFSAMVDEYKNQTSSVSLEKSKSRVRLTTQV